MADVCVIYSRDEAADLPVVIESLLAPDISVWWDQKIQHGNYRQEILRQLGMASCVVPIWTANVVKSMVMDEADHARQTNVPILPINVHDALPPLGYTGYQTTNAIGWTGERDNTAILEHMQKIRNLVRGKPSKSSKPNSLLPEYDIPVPAYFFSLSSFETKISPLQGARAASLFGVKSLLASAQDTGRSAPRGVLMESLKRIRTEGGVVLLDSGNYEAGRLNKLRTAFEHDLPNGFPAWSRSEYHRALEVTPHDFAFCFDALKPPEASLDSVVSTTVNAVEQDRRNSDKPVLPIVHMPYSEEGGALSNYAAEAVTEVSKTLAPTMIGIPERELGDGILARASTMRSIRTHLRDLSYYQPIHILGTGDPISIALLSAAGADSFDGLEWCRYTLDSHQARLYPIQDYDLFRWQDELSDVFTRVSSHEESLTFTWLGRVAIHNIEFYLSWMQELREACVSNSRMVEFLTRLVPGEELGEVHNILLEG